VPFDGLLVASGARARRPTFPGADLAGVTTLRTLQDAQAILDAVLLRSARQAVVIGGGPLAIELATALAERGVHTTLLVRGKAVLSGAIDDVASGLVVARMRQLGVDVRLEDEVEEARGDGGRVRAVKTHAGNELPCDLLGVAIGVVPNSEWLADCELDLERGAIVVDEHMRTSVERVWAAGDVARPDGPVLQLWEPAQLQGRTAAASMTGHERPYRRRVHYFATRLGDLDFASVGTTRDEDADDVIVSRDTEAVGAIAYRKLWLSGGRLVGALMIGHRSERVRRRGRAFRKMIERELDVGRARDLLLDPHFDADGWIAQAALLVPRPEVRVAHQARASAVVRGTQTIRIDSPEPRVDVDAATMQASQLSIGFRSPVTRAVRLEESAGFLVSQQQRYPLELRTVIIGRGRLCDIVLEDGAVSHRHASVSRHGRVLYLRDLGSRHGTWVNEALVTTPHALEHGDRLRLGRVQLYFEAPGSSLRDPAEKAARQTPSHALLQGVAGPSLGLSFHLEPDAQTTIGRDASSTVRLDDISVSRRHALVSGAGGTWTICDLHSSRGTSKNGALLEPGRDEALHDGDELRFGDTVVVFRRARTP
jgi:pSer/pThr/pTyr-binding forkhead associated (FHA) protein